MRKFISSELKRDIKRLLAGVFKCLLIIYLAKAWKLLNKNNKDSTRLIAPFVFVFAVSTVLLWRPL